MARAHSKDASIAVHHMLGGIGGRSSVEHEVVGDAEYHYVIFTLAGGRQIKVDFTDDESGVQVWNIGRVGLELSLGITLRSGNMMEVHPA
jgi:hypothetical protein